MTNVAKDLHLAIETSSRRGSVAVGRAGQLIASRAISEDHKHAAELLPAIHDILREASAGPGEVDVLCFSRGPGSFTGLRVAATIARLWQSVVDCHVVAAPSLEVIARNALTHPARPGQIAVMLDAREGQIYGALFERADDELTTVSAAAMQVVDGWIAALPDKCHVLGDGVKRHHEKLDARGLITLPEEYWYPDARQTLAISFREASAGRFCESEAIVPEYLRPPECEEMYEKRRAEARERRGE